MFKGILPSKRIASSDFTMVTPTDIGKENKPRPESQDQSKPTAKLTRPQTAKPKSQLLEKLMEKDSKKAKPKDQLAQEPRLEMNDAFDQLLDDLQIPSTLRPKLIGMDSTVKAAMLKSSQVLTLNPSSTSTLAPPLTPNSKILRKAHSSESLGSPRPPNSMDFPRGSPVRATDWANTSIASGPRLPSGHVRGVSCDTATAMARGQVTAGDLAKSSKDKGPVKNLTPSRFFSILTGTSSTQLEVENVKKLRLLLRNESATWSQEFLRLGGYGALLTRLNEILEVEWREEQHDDKILHELLRCIKALSTSSIGCFALRSSCPTPFVQLVALLYSDKKPGDVATRQLIAELLLILFEIYPSDSLPSRGSAPRQEAWSNSPTNLITLPPPHRTLFSLIRALLLTPAPPPAESPASPVSPHAFIEVLHTPRIYKTYLGELGDVCRDYFWVFCHPNNTVWELGSVDEKKVEAPVAPGGMTGGVEFEAMAYLTTHLKLLNAIASAAEDMKLPKEDDHSAHRFHSDLFLSGIERILLVARKASTTYYPTLHLELSRYIAFTGRAGYELPWTISRLVGPPPAAMCRPGVVMRGSPRSSPAKRVAGVPSVPTPTKVEPLKLKFD